MTNDVSAATAAKDEYRPGPMTWVPDAPEKTSTPHMPPEIAKAVIRVMSEVKKLGKEGENTVGRGYKFTTVDQFYEALGPLMAAHGLMDIALERETSVEARETVDDYGKVKKSSWLTAVFDFWLFHESGASYGPITRHIQVVASGPQSYASAQSFAEKYFLRNLFKVPTGDIDEVEQSAQTGLPSNEPINDLQYEELSTEISSQGGSTEAKFKEQFGDPRALPAAKFDEAMAKLKARRAKIGKAAP